MVDFIHIGDYKTGTTWLQRFAFHHPEIDYLGDPVDYKLDYLLRELVNTPDFMYKEEILKEKFKLYFQRRKKTNKIIGFSREGLVAEQAWRGDNIYRNAERLKNIFGKNVKIIYVIREQKSMILSMYSQYIKRGGNLSLKNFLFDPYQNQSFIERFKYDLIIEKYIELFGEENVWIGLYEEFRYNKEEFLKKLYNFIGCKDIDFKPNGMNYFSNTSLKIFPLYILKFLNRFIRSEFNNKGYLIPLDNVINKLFSNTKKLKKLEEYSKVTMIPYYEKAQKFYINKHINDAFLKYLVKIAYKINWGSKIKFDKDIELFLEDIYKENNNILKNIYKLDIQKYGWVL